MSFKLLACRHFHLLLLSNFISPLTCKIWNFGIFSNSSASTCSKRVDVPFKLPISYLESLSFKRVPFPDRLTLTSAGAICASDRFSQCFLFAVRTWLRVALKSENFLRILV